MVLLLFAATTVAAQDARSLYRAGSDALAESSYAPTDAPLYDAIELFQRALSVNPNYREALVGLAEAYYALEEYATALRYAQRARELGPRSTPLKNLEGRIRLARGDVENARQLFREVLREEPNNLEARLGMSQLALAQGNSAEAARELERLLRRSPDNRRALLALTLIYQNRGDAAAAQRYLRQALRFHSENPQVQLLAGEYRYARGEYEEARFHAETALTLRPDYTDARVLLAETLLETGDTYGAEVQLQQAAENAPENPRVWYTLGHVLQEQGKTDEALRALQRGASIAPGEERLTLAIEGVAQELPLEDDRREPVAREYLQRGRELVQRNLLSQAQVLFRSGLRLDPYSRELRLALADIYELRGYRARYLQELEVLRELGHDDQFITDRIESYESYLANSVANSWGVDQFTLERERYTLFLGFVERQERGEWYRNDRLFAEQFRDFLLWDERLEVFVDVTPVADHAELLRHARERGDQYAVLLSFSENDRSLASEVTLYLTRTGQAVTTMRTVRGGNDRVQNTVDQGSDLVRSAIPRRGSLVRREFSLGLIDLGRVSGIEPEQSFRLVREGAAQLVAEPPGIQFSAANVVGSFTVTRVDDLVAEGTIETDAVIDRIRVGDQLFILPEDFEPIEGAEAFRSPLFESIESLR
jgi:tetratricopeptide (TPR) repeat protein